MAQTATMDLATVKDAVKTQLLEVQGIGQVETKRGGVKTWLKDPRPARNHWEIHTIRVGPPEGADIGPSRFELHQILIEGWMPFSYSNPDSTVLWDALIKAIGGQLESNMSLGAVIWNAERLELQGNDIRPVGGAGTQAEIAGDEVPLCHWARFLLRVECWHTFSTT